MRAKTFPMSYSFSYDVLIDGGGAGTTINMGSFLNPNCVIMSGFAIVTRAFVGPALPANTTVSVGFAAPDTTVLITTEPWANFTLGNAIALAAAPGDLLAVGNTQFTVSIGAGGALTDGAMIFFLNVQQLP